MKVWQSKWVRLGLSFILSANFAFAGENPPKALKRAQAPVEIKVKTWGPTQTEVDRAKNRVEQSAAVQNALKGAKYRLVLFDYIESQSEKSQPSAQPTRFRVVFYDYTNDRTFVAEGDFAGFEKITVRRENFEPGVAAEEFRDAIEVIKKDVKLGALFKEGKLKIFDAMPAISNLNGERLVNVGVRFVSEDENLVVGVSFKNEKVIRYEGNAPPTSLAAPETCGIPSAGQSYTPNGLSGQYQLSVTQNGTALWEMLVIRPSSSSGNPNERSGIEVRDVKYKGKSVLKRGHVPVLNVQYAGDVCGPYRDWQYNEGMFDAPEEGAENPAPGIRILAPGKIARTAIETGNDLGNFLGVAVYRQDVGFGMETVLVSEMNAGWYRYIMEWRFAPDGTIRPRYGFGSTNNSCVCTAHNHHAYWRFDFDIVKPANNIFQIERGRKFMQPVTTEVTRTKNYATNRGFLIQNSGGDEAYMLMPNLGDHVTDAFGGGDFWFLQYKGTGAVPDELDDPNANIAANFSPWVNGESLINKDIVVWYAAHYIHEAGDDHLVNPDNAIEVLSGSHTVGPNLRPVRW